VTEHSSMKWVIVTSIFSLTVLAHGCADAEFAGNGAQAVRAPKKPPTLTPPITNDPTTTNGNDNGLMTDDGGQVACVRAPNPLPFDFSIAWHRDQHESSSSWSHVERADVKESPVQRFHVSSISGDVLPVTEFSLDDVAFIVKETDQFAAIGRTINIPDHALIIKDGNNVHGASGAIDSEGLTSYNYRGQQVKINSASRDLAAALNTISAMGITPINHNEIKISDMREKGFIDAAGNVAFKVVHVAHGAGFINMKYTLQPCK
jgi:hypothetical protein